MINGLSAVLEDWAPLDQILSRSRPVIIYDHRGIGKSSALPDDELTIEKMATDALDLVEFIGFKEVDVLGFSMGGMVAQAATLLSLSHSVKVKKAILAMTFAKRPKGQGGRYFASIRGSNKSKEEITRGIWELQYDQDWLQNEENKKIIEKRMKVGLATRRPAQQIANQSRAVATTDLRPRLPEIPSFIPVLIIAGKRDRMAYYQESEDLVQFIRHAKRIEGDDEIGHMFYDYGNVEDWGSRLTVFLDAASSKAHL